MPKPKFLDTHTHITNAFACMGIPILHHNNTHTHYVCHEMKWLRTQCVLHTHTYGNDIGRLIVCRT